MIVLRAAEPSDAPALYALHTRTWREAYWSTLPQEAASDRALYDQAYWRGAIAASRRADGRDMALIVAEETPGYTLIDAQPERAPSDPLVAFAYMGGSRGGTREGVPWDAELYMLYVLERMQSQGLGAALMGACARHAVSRGFFTLGLWCLADNPGGRAFYEALGGMRKGARVQTVNGAPARVVGYCWDHEGVADLMAGVSEEDG